MLMAHREAMSGPRLLFDPSACPFPPLIRVPDYLNPFTKRGVAIFAAPLFGVSCPNVKAFMVKCMLDAALERGELAGVHTLVEATSGNTGLSLGMLARCYGIERVVAIVPYDAAPGKLEQLRLAGVDYQMDKDTIGTARAMGAHAGWLNLNQYSNPDNCAAHERFTGPHIWGQTKGKLAIFSAALGTTGTIIGTRRCFEAMAGKQRPIMIGATCAVDAAVPGVRTLEGLNQIGFNWRDHIDVRQDVSTRQAYIASLALLRAGIMAGPAAGLAFSALLSVLKDFSERGTLGEMQAVFACGDTALPYMDKYSTRLDPPDLVPPNINEPLRPDWFLL